MTRVPAPLIGRRHFIGGAALGLMTEARRVAAQPAHRVVRIGILGLNPTSNITGPEPRSASTRALIGGLQDLGYVYGRHYVTEARGADARPERFPALAAELIQLRVDVIVAPGPALPALKQTSIPVVMAASPDPLAQGLVKSLGRPGGNFTGLSLQSVETTGKRLELLQEATPGAGAVGVLWNQASVLNWRAAETAARERRWKALSLEIREVGEVESALKAAANAGAGALLVFAASLLFPHDRRVTELVARSRLPAMYELRNYVEAGGLMSYGADITDVWRRAAGYVDKILKGTSARDLAIEQPTEFELVINRKTARALGLTLAQSLLVRADELIDR